MPGSGISRSGAGVPYTNLGRPHALVHVDVETGRATLGGRYIRLPLVEFRLLALLVQHAGTVLTSEQLAARLGGTWAGSPGKAAQAVRRLRTKLGDSAAESRYITSMYGGYYRFNPAAVAPKSAPLAAYTVTVINGRLSMPCPHDGCPADLLAAEPTERLTRLRELAAWHELDHWAVAL